MSSETCAYLVYPGSRYVDPQPPEWCEEEAVAGTEFCNAHMPPELAGDDRYYWYDDVD